MRRGGVLIQMSVAMIVTWQNARVRERKRYYKHFAKRIESACPSVRPSVFICAMDHSCIVAYTLFCVRCHATELIQVKLLLKPLCFPKKTKKLRRPRTEPLTNPLCFQKKPKKTKHWRDGCVRGVNNAMCVFHSSRAGLLVF